MKGQLLYYRSRLDENLQPLPVCETDDRSTAKALILDLSPGAISDLDRSVQRCAELAAWAEQEGTDCVVAKPCGRGPGTVYQGPAEVDVFEAVEFLCEVCPIDRDRISLMGGSMGGAATWYLASHYPDQFAAAAPFCGYCDYRLWTKPGGYIMRMQPWEEFSWQSRGAVFRPANLGNMGLWITHGEWDIGIGGGVPVEHSRRMSRALDELGIAHKYVEVPRCGHGCMREDAVRPVLAWLGRQRRAANPDRVRLVVHGLRHNRSHWVAVRQLERYGQRAAVDACFESGNRLIVKTENVRRLSLGPSPGRSEVEVCLDDETFGDTDVAAAPACFDRRDGQWRRCGSAELPPNEKRHGASGPASDIFFEPLRLVRATGGGDHENALIELMSGTIPGHFKKENGGVHRGIFSGESSYDIPVTADTDLSEEDTGNCNLLFLGTFKSNKALAQFERQLPLEFGEGEIRLAGETYKGRHLGISACFPSPANAERLLLITGGVTPEAITGATHLNLQLLPDFLIWDGDEVLDYGFFDSAWQVT